MGDSGPDNERLEEMKGIEVPQRTPDSLRSGIWAIGVAVIAVAITIISGYPMCWLSGLATVGALLCGGIAVVVGLSQKQNRMRPRLWHHLVTLVTIVALLYLLTFGPGNPLSLVHIRARALLALTGGQDKLQSWAVEVLAKPRDRMQEDGSGWRVPREEWSRQVQRLGGGVRIDPLLEGERCAVCLGYGGGFLHWYIVVGPPGSVPDPTLVKRRPYDAWFRWGDGIYCWFPET